MSHAALLVALDNAFPDLESAIAFQMAPFDEGDAGWFADGSRWDWWQIGGRYAGRLSDETVIRRGDLDLTVLAERERTRLTASYQHGMESDPKMRGFLYDILDGETLDAFLERRCSGFPGHYAFLRNRCWHEHERMGWFAVATATECERAGNETHICLHEQDGAKIVSWNGVETWGKTFYPRFVEPLPPETLLVTVDYHV